MEGHFKLCLQSLYVRLFTFSCFASEWWRVGSRGSSLNMLNPDWLTGRQFIRSVRVASNSSIVVEPSNPTTWKVMTCQILLSIAVSSLYISDIRILFLNLSIRTIFAICCCRYRYRYSCIVYSENPRTLELEANSFIRSLKIPY